MENDRHFHSLVSLADCKLILGIDDREDAFTEFLLISSSYAIEEYCMRRLLYRRVKEWFVDCADWTLPLKEYPVREIIVVESRNGSIAAEIATPEYYTVMPETGTLENVPFLLHITPTRIKNRVETIFVKYIAGYKQNEVPPSLKDACIELVAWKYARHKGKQLGVMQSSKTETSLENKMPQNVKELLEPWRRKTI